MFALQNFLNGSDNIEKLFFSSTDCVYGECAYGEKKSETSPLNPVNTYGVQKIEAEKEIIKNGFTVTRLPFMIGKSLLSKPHFYDRIKEKLSRGESVEMIDGLSRSVLSYKKTAEILYALSRKDGVPQVINVCGDDSYTKYEMGLKLAAHFGADSSLIEKISEEEGRKFFVDRRASSGVMDNTLLKNILEAKEIKWECE